MPEKTIDNSDGDTGAAATIRRRRIEQKIAIGTLFAGGVVVVLMVAAIFIFIGRESLPLFTDVDQRNDMSLYHDTEYEDDFARDATIFGVLENLIGQVWWQPVSDQALFSLWPLFAGTFKITLVAVAEAVVLSFFTALAIAFYLPLWLRYKVKIIVELMAGIPSVVLGFLGLMFFATYMQDLFGTTYRLNTFLAGSVLSLTCIPIVTTLMEDIYSSYPKEQILAAKSAGLYDYQVILHIITPATYGKTLAAVLLGFGRCFGETMIILMCSGNAAILSWSFSESSRTFAATIGAEMAEVVMGDTHYSVLFFLGFILTVITYLINFLSQKLIRRWTYA